MSQLPSLALASTDERMTDRYTSQPSADTPKLQLHRTVVLVSWSSKILEPAQQIKRRFSVGVAKFIIARVDSSNWQSLAKIIVCLFTYNTCTGLDRPWRFHRQRFIDKGHGWNAERSIGASQLPNILPVAYVSVTARMTCHMGTRTSGFYSYTHTHTHTYTRTRAHTHTCRQAEENYKKKSFCLHVKVVTMNESRRIAKTSHVAFVIELINKCAWNFPYIWRKITCAEGGT
jgi:hypothetical protein